MQKDFHFYCTAVLARMSGFSSEESLIIAYAAQYVDDSTESEPIMVGDTRFDTVRTAHTGLNSINWDVQKKIYIPFHFLPSNTIRSGTDSYITKANSVFANNLLKKAFAEEESLLRLCQIGCALHTFEDTFSHQGFSGRHHEENDVENIRIESDGKYKHLFWENIFLDCIFKIGHGEAGHFPDIPFVNWKYDGCKAKNIVRKNVADFFSAAKTIYDTLVFLNKGRKPMDWNTHKDTIAMLLKDSERDLELRCNKWSNAFSGLFSNKKNILKYDKYAWRNDALKPKTQNSIRWDKFQQSHFATLKFPGSKDFFSSKWVAFHKAALKQRHFVLENIV